LDTTGRKPAKWLRYVDDTSVVWPQEPGWLQKFHHYLNSLRPTIKLSIEVENNNTLPFDALNMKRGPKLATKVYRKLLVQVVMCTSIATTHITWQGESFRVWSVEPRSYVRFRRISTTTKLRT
jgi:hypothetical protein